MSMSYGRAKAIWEQALENHKKLESCKAHDFSIDLSPNQSFGKRWRCVHCGGEVDQIAKYWYEQGRKHGEGVSNGG